MFSSPVTIAISLAYVGLLFFVAWTGDRQGKRLLTGRRRTLVYALSLAVYCTSWTYYGSVGLASAHGLDFLPIYIGPILVFGFGHRLVAAHRRLARDQNLTTVADFVSARYGKSQSSRRWRRDRADGGGALYRAAAQGDHRRRS